MALIFLRGKIINYSRNYSYVIIRDEHGFYKLKFQKEDMEEGRFKFGDDICCIGKMVSFNCGRLYLVYPLVMLFGRSKGKHVYYRPYFYDRVFKVLANKLKIFPLTKKLLDSKKKLRKTNDFKRLLLPELQDNV